MSDNGACYVSHDYAKALGSLRLKHLRIKPGRPRRHQRKAEPLILTLLHECAYARVYGQLD
jgi:transposase InsO family protein